MSQVAAIAATLTVALAGCGSDPAGDHGTADGRSTKLELTLDPDGSGGEPARSETISCEVDSGCADGVDQLTATDFAPPADVACTQVYGGPDTLTVVGTLRGEQVSGAFGRSDGCEIARFDRFATVLKALFPGYVPGAALEP